MHIAFFVKSFEVHTLKYLLNKFHDKAMKD